MLSRWRLDPGGKWGVLTVDCGDLREARDLPVIRAMAELAALHHLLVTEEVAGAGRTGKGLRITVSSEGVYRTFLGTQKSGDLIQWGRWLRVRFAAADLGVSRDPVPGSRIRMDGEIVARFPLDIIMNPEIGPVILSRHAIERMERRARLKTGLDGAYRRARHLLSMEPDRWRIRGDEIHIAAGGMEFRGAAHEISPSGSVLLIRTVVRHYAPVLKRGVDVVSNDEILCR